MSKETKRVRAALKDLRSVAELAAAGRSRDEATVPLKVGSALVVDPVTRELVTRLKDILFSSSHGTGMGGGERACECGPCERARMTMRRLFGEEWYK